MFNFLDVNKYNSIKKMNFNKSEESLRKILKKLKYFLDFEYQRKECCPQKQLNEWFFGYGEHLFMQVLNYIKKITLLWYLNIISQCMH